MFLEAGLDGAVGDAEPSGQAVHGDPLGAGGYQLGGDRRRRSRRGLGWARQGWSRRRMAELGSAWLGMDTPGGVGNGDKRFFPTPPLEGSRGVLGRHSAETGDTK